MVPGVVPSLVVVRAWRGTQHGTSLIWRGTRHGSSHGVILGRVWRGTNLGTGTRQRNERGVVPSKVSS